MQARLVLIAITTGVLFAGLARAESVDASAAEALIKKSKCGTCHSLDKKKEGPSYKETATKYKGKPDGAQKLFTHLTTSPKVKVEGKEETHDNPKSTNEAEIKNLIAWILSR
ncbi:MAG: c-type cytochrome [Betaproteobacteria bacterium]